MRGPLVIDKAVIDDVLSRTNIVDVVSSRIDLKKGKALCPFHEEKSPSFSVHEGRQIFKCFGCGEGGDAVAFVMRYDGVDFNQAVRVLARDVGVNIENTSPPIDGPVKLPQSQIDEIEECCWFAIFFIEDSRSNRKISDSDREKYKKIIANLSNIQRKINRSDRIKTAGMVNTVIEAHRQSRPALI